MHFLEGDKYLYDDTIFSIISNVFLKYFQMDGCCVIFIFMHCTT